MRCTKCGFNVSNIMKFCPECGTKIIPVKEKIQIKVYVHGDKETAAEAAEKAGLDDKAAANFAYCAYEVELLFEVNTKTGEYTMLSVNGRKLA